MDAGFQRREARLDEKLVGALLFHLAGAQFERGGLEPVAQRLKRCDAEADDEGDDEAEWQGILDFAPIQVVAELMPAN